MEAKPVVVEYLIIIKQEGTFCDSDKSFLKFLSIDSSLSISEEENKMSFLYKKKDFVVSYTLVSGLVPSQKERYFKLALFSKENKLDEFTELSKLLEYLFLKLHSEVSINILWNDIARKYAIEGYELINEVENLLRRLITSFMLVNVGYDWYKYHLPSSVGNRNIQLKESYSDYLHQTYFSDLKTILFEGQRDVPLRDIGEVQKFVERCVSEGKKEISIDDLKGVISKSLWEKYFAKDTTYKKTDLESDLENLNSLRNEIAHNRHIDRAALGKIQGLTKRIIKTLKLEIEDLPNKVLTPAEQKFQVNTEIMRMTMNSPSMHAYFAEVAVLAWYKSNFGFENADLVNSAGDSRIDILVKDSDGKRIGVRVRALTIDRLKQMRNQIVHEKSSRYIFPREVDDFEEFHLVMVLKDYIAGDELLFTEPLKSVLSAISQKYRLIIGYLNENGFFVKIELSKLNGE